MNASPWSVTATDPPADAAVVWVRPTWYTPPTLATWNATLSTWTLASGLVAPWYTFWKWAPQ